MKKSEILENQIETEDNDLRVLGLMNKKLREQRKENFEGKWLVQLQERFTVTGEPEKGRYIIHGSSGQIMDFYPKANKILIRNTNKWIKPGLRWIVNNLINKK